MVATVKNRWCQAESPLKLHVQVVLHIFRSPSEILTGFDVDCACVGYDGEAVWALPRAVRALRTGYNLVNPVHSWPNRPSYELRLLKYDWYPGRRVCALLNG